MRLLRRKLLRDLWRLKAQVATIALVVASGVGGFIGSLSTHTSLLWLRDSYYESARFAHVFASARRVPNALLPAIRAIPGVLDVEAAVAGQATVLLPGVSDTISSQLLSLPAGPDSGVNRLLLRQGRWPTTADSDGVLLGEAFAKARNIRPGDSFAILLNGKRQSVRVTGIAISPAYIFTAAAGGMATDATFALVWMPRPRLAAAYDLTGGFNLLSLRLARTASVPATLARLDALLVPYGSTGAYGRKDQASHRTLSQEIEEQRVFGTVLPAVFLAVAVFLLNVLLSRHIATERSNIAALKALGVADRQIGWHYMGLVLLTALLGVLAGLAIGVWFGRWMTNLYTGYFHFPAARFRLDSRIVLLACALALAGAVAAAVLAVNSIVKLRPAAAMQPPTPARYRRTWLDATAFGRWLPVAARMAVRDLQRRPLRALLSTAGIASSVAIMVAGTWTGDAFDYLVQLELYQRDRAQILLSSYEPAGVTALGEIARLPGVLQVEGYRMLPVRLHHGRWQYRTTLSGIDPGAQLHQVLSPQLRPQPVSAGGVLLTDRLASALRARPGDLLAVEPLQGARRVHTVPVTGITGDLMGMQAYMDRRAVARLVDEGDTFNVARLRIDPLQRAQLFAALQQRPRVAAASDKDRLVAQFRGTTQRNMRVLAAILGTFAAVIAIGVVYNSARIALAEHAWEIATLRVVGLTRAEASWVLLGQLAFLILVAIPVGCVAGYALARLIVSLIAAEEFRIPLVVSSATYARAILIMLGAGIMSGLLVRRRVDQLDLVGVLKARE